MLSVNGRIVLILTRKERMKRWGWRGYEVSQSRTFFTSIKTQLHWLTNYYETALRARQLCSVCEQKGRRAGVRTKWSFLQIDTLCNELDLLTAALRLLACTWCSRSIIDFSTASHTPVRILPRHRWVSQQIVVVPYRECVGCSGWRSTRRLLVAIYNCGTVRLCYYYYSNISFTAP